MNNWKGLPIVIFGNMGAAKEARFLVDEINFAVNVPVFDFCGYVTVDGNGNDVVCSDGDFFDYTSKFTLLGVCLPFGNPHIKQEVFNKITAKNIVYPNLIHPRAIIAKTAMANMGIGNIISVNAVIEPDVKIGNFVFINSSSTIGHDSIVGDFSVINIAANISGNCSIGKNVLIGTNCSVKQWVTVNDSAVCGMGAIIVQDVASGDTMISPKACKLKNNDVM